MWSAGTWLATLPLERCDMDDYELGAVIFMAIILCGIIGFTFPHIFG